MKPAAFERVRAALSALKPEVKKPWVILDRLPYIHATDDPNARPYSTPVVGRFDYMESADYIMACNPAAMSDILAYVDAIKAERDAAMKDAERYRWLTRTSDTNKLMVVDTDTQRMYFGWEADDVIDAAKTYGETE